MHQTMYDPLHRFFCLSGNPSLKVKYYQKGMRERLLCDGCEMQFSRYESYASGIFFGDQNCEIHRDGHLVHLSKLTYAPLKLFFLSLLWRMAVCSIDTLKGISLGPHEERLRQLLLAEDPGHPLTYPCLITAVMHEGAHIHDMIVRPAQGRVDGCRLWSFVAAGLLFSFVVCGHRTPAQLNGVVLNTDGTMAIVVRELKNIPGLHNFLAEIGQAHRERMRGTD